MMSRAYAVIIISRFRPVFTVEVWVLPSLFETLHWHGLSYSGAYTNISIKILVKPLPPCM
jgi:hypothetical protein